MHTLLILSLVLWVVPSSMSYPKDYKSDFINEVQIESQSPKLTHSGFAPDDHKQEIVNYAYELGWLDFVLMLECENWNRNPLAVGDGGDSYWLCQMNRRFHKIPQEYYDDWGFQVEYCYQKRSTGTKFYWPSRKIKWMKCSEYVKDRFIFW